MIVIANVFRRSLTGKTRLKHYLERASSAPPSTGNVLMGAKNLWNLHESTFMRSFDHSEEKWFAKCLPYWNIKACGWFLTLWLPMTSVLFGIVRICISQFKCLYLKNGKLFLKFFFDLWNIHQILNIFKKKMIVIAKLFLQLQTVKHLVKPLFRKRLFRTWFDSQVDKGSKTLVKYVWEHFYRVFWSLWQEIT